ncbi:Uncharacterised protein [Mycobacteroides abscessus subsp. abscessus]|nr:Uncharacterised protein [Mycobacteroides abscessus subsp. abscessus]
MLSVASATATPAATARKRFLGFSAAIPMPKAKTVEPRIRSIDSYHDATSPLFGFRHAPYHFQTPRPRRMTPTTTPTTPPTVPVSPAMDTRSATATTTPQTIASPRIQPSRKLQPAPTDRLITSAMLTITSGADAISRPSAMGRTSTAARIT